MAEAESQNRLRRFASFFKGYMGVMPLVTAAFAPLLTMAKAIPVFESQKTTLATYSGLLGFLLLAWVFYARRAFVKSMIPSALRATAPGSITLFVGRLRRLTINMLPLILILSSAYCFLSYLRILDSSIAASLQEFNSHPHGPGDAEIVNRTDVLQKWGALYSIHDGEQLEAYYLGIFLCAELAFVFMALREYAYGVLKISEVEVLGPIRRAAGTPDGGEGSSVVRGDGAGKKAARLGGPG
jgi:hypothetical protein